VAIEIRDAGEQDAEALVRLLVEAQQPHVVAEPRIFRPIEDTAPVRRYLEGLIAREECGVFIADLDGEPVGCLWLSEQDEEDHVLLSPRRFAQIESVVVTAAARRLGIARALLERAHRWAGEKDLDHVELNVYEFNRSAIALYERLGYTTFTRGMWRALNAGGTNAGR
jgi:ribosomal protein S18 acetylase RimI-like enzyme